MKAITYRQTFSNYEKIAPDRYAGYLISINDSITIEYLASAIYTLISSSEEVQICIELGIHNILFELIEHNLPFKSRQEIFRTICWLITPANLEQAVMLIEHMGFMSLMTEYSESMSDQCSFETIDALIAVERSAKMAKFDFRKFRNYEFIGKDETDRDF